MSNSMPHVKWYGRDWIGDPLLRMVGLQERGLWIDLLSVMMMSEPYGHLAVNGKAMSDEDAARLTGTDPGTYKQVIARIEAVGICSRTPDGIMYSRRLVRDYELYRVASESGKRGGGNPKLKPHPSLPSPEKDPESRIQNPESTLPLPGSYKGRYKGVDARDSTAVKTFKQWGASELREAVQAANSDRLLDNEEIDEFVAYWMEPSATGRTRMSMEKTWDTRRRMQTALRVVFLTQRTVRPVSKSSTNEQRENLEAARERAVKLLVDGLMRNVPGSEASQRMLSAANDKYRDLGPNKDGKNVVDEALAIVRFKRRKDGT